MKWLIIIIALFSANAGARWVQFEACGFDEPLDDSPLSIEQTLAAPTLGPGWIWAPSVNAVVGLSEKRMAPGSTPCSIMFIQGRRFNVVGTLEEVMRKLRDAGK